MAMRSSLALHLANDTSCPSIAAQANMGLQTSAMPTTTLSKRRRCVLMPTATRTMMYSQRSLRRPDLDSRSFFVPEVEARIS